MADERPTPEGMPPEARWTDITVVMEDTVGDGFATHASLRAEHGWFLDVIGQAIEGLEARIQKGTDVRDNLVRQELLESLLHALVTGNPGHG